jgi:hypothetical protein
VVTGKVTDANTGDPIPFVNVFVPNTMIGTTTDFNGRYTLEVRISADSLSASYVGYKPRTKYLPNEPQQEINFQLEETVRSLDEVVILAGENPAFPILRNIVDRRRQNDKRSLKAYEYETYTKVEIDVDNLSEKFRQGKFMRKITQVMDSVEQIAGEDGKPILPLFISESLSDFYYRDNPQMRHEKIRKTKITGVGNDDGSTVAQFIGSSFQQYNFYQSWLNIGGKDFISPIAVGWRTYYDYELQDSLFIGDEYCYRIEFFPKSEQDLAFSGTMWIAKEDYAIKRIDAMIGQTANLNYIEKIRIQQELVRTTAGPWLPEQTRVLMDIGEITKNMAGVLAKFYTSNRNITVNEPRPSKFYARPIEVMEDYQLDADNEEYWDQNRHEPLSSTEKSVYQMIDTLKSIPTVRTYTDIIKVATYGYKKLGKIDLGPYLALYANNSVEGHRFHLGMRTNIDFSNKWVLGGYLAYGTKDEEIKYRAFVEHIADRRRWTSIRIAHGHEIDQVGLSVEDLLNNNIFLAATRFGTLNRPYYQDYTRITAQREVFKGFTPKVTFTHRYVEPLFDFAYYTTESQQMDQIASEFTTTELRLEARFAKDEIYVQNDNDRISLGTLKWPIFTVQYARGFEGFLGGDFSYNKVRVNISDKFKVGFLGTSSLSLTAGKIFETLPYPLLRNHIGNESIWYTTAAFNQMNWSEFTSDQYVSVRWFHYFEGFLLNRIPLMKKLKWRLLATGNVLWGSLKPENRESLPEFTSEGNPTEPIGYLRDGKPYVEIGYGIENIFKIFRIDFIHRLTYLENPDVKKFGVKISFQFIL